MADLGDGESVEVKGSGARPYVLRNVGGVYSCSCPAWRNQSVPIERRTCKHLRRLRGDEAERARVGEEIPPSPEATAGVDAGEKAGPPLATMPPSCRLRGPLLRGTTTSAESDLSGKGRPAVRREDRRVCHPPRARSQSICSIT